MLKMIGTGDSSDLTSQELEIVAMLKQQVGLVAETSIPPKMLAQIPSGANVIQTFENLSANKSELKSAYLALNFPYFQRNDLFQLYTKTFFGGQIMKAIENATEALELGMSMALARNEKMGRVGGPGECIMVEQFIDLLITRSELGDGLKTGIRERRYPYINKIIILLNNMVDAILKDEYVQMGGGQTVRMIDYFFPFISEANQSLVIGMKQNVNIITEHSNVKNIVEGLAAIATGMNKSPYRPMTKFMAIPRGLGEEELDGDELSRTKKALTLFVDQNQALLTYLYARFKWGKS
jgi:hypothetical protein